MGAMGEMALRRQRGAFDSAKRGTLSRRSDKRKRVIRVDLSKHSLRRFMERVQNFRELNVSLVHEDKQGTMITKYGLISQISFGELQGLDALREIERITGESLREYMPKHLLRAVNRNPSDGRLAESSSQVVERRRTILLDDEPSKTWLDNLLNVLRDVLKRVLGRD